MDVSFVVAMSRDRIIGRAGALPWRLPRDLKRFRELTWGKPIVMGRKTHESIGRPLPGRTNIILSRTEGFQAEDCQVAHSVDQALEQARGTGADEIMIVGGGEVYRAFLPVCSRIHLTLVEGNFKGDARFPVDVMNSPDWEIVREERWDADDRNLHDARYLVLERRDQKSTS